MYVHLIYLPTNLWFATTLISKIIKHFHYLHTYKVNTTTFMVFSIAHYGDLYCGIISYLECKFLPSTVIMAFTFYNVQTTHLTFVCKKWNLYSIIVWFQIASVTKYQNQSSVVVLLNINKLCMLYQLPIFLWWKWINGIHNTY